MTKTVILNLLSLVVYCQFQIGVDIPSDLDIPVDVYFLADNTGSMLQEISLVTEEAKSMFNYLAAQTSRNIRFGVGAYKDFNDDFVFRNLLNLTGTSSSISSEDDPIIQAMSEWQAQGGGDKHEAQLYALLQIATTQYDQIGWRGGETVKIVVWFGDAPAKDPFGRTENREAITEEFVTQILIDKGIRISAFDAADMNESGQAERIATATGGKFTKMFRPPQNQSTATASSIAIAYTNVSSMGTVPGFDPTDVSTPMFNPFNPPSDNTFIDTNSTQPISEDPQQLPPEASEFLPLLEEEDTPPVPEPLRRNVQQQPISQPDFVSTQGYFGSAGFSGDAIVAVTPSFLGNLYAPGVEAVYESVLIPSVQTDNGTAFESAFLPTLIVSSVNEIVVEAATQTG
eukprot:TRINITY_DN2576_c0_g1_i5.p2 TRINITY_DN2576_c0_g1~~TRINITY_DN2576_c0_g1_i5.p2  ORF type:complete len:400 (-),score=55.28 TRINITY_DN2576_c0_g1_i5:1080-2279(-)